MKRAAGELGLLALIYIVVGEYGLVSLLIGLPIAAGAPFAWSRAKAEWRRLSALR